MTEQLKPCPFCGKPASLWEKGTLANCEQHAGDIFPMPIEWWQTRPIEDALRAEVEQMKYALEKYANMSNWEQKEQYGPYGSYYVVSWKYDEHPWDIAREALEEK